MEKRVLYFLLSMIIGLSVYSQDKLEPFNITYTGTNYFHKKTFVYNSIVGGTNQVVIDKTSTIVGGSDNNNNTIYSFIGGGYDNNIWNANNASIVGGYQNNINGGNSVICGGYTNWIGPDGDTGSSFIGGGEGNIIRLGAVYSVIAGGYINILYGGAGGNQKSFIGGGDRNVISNSRYSVIIGGSQNLMVPNGANAYCNSIGGGEQNYMYGTDVEYSSIFGGRLNTITGSYNTISGGRENAITGEYSSIIGGYRNKLLGNFSCIGGSEIYLNGSFSTVSGGDRNKIIGSDKAFIGGGTFNIITNARYSTIGGGYNNKIYTYGANSYSHSILGGEGNRIVGNDVVYSTVLGGFANTISGSWCVVGGRDNAVTGAHSVIVGGLENRVGYSSGSSGASMVGCGQDNYIFGNSDYSIIGAGQNNSLSGDWNGILGGGGNVLGNNGIVNYASIVGGEGNIMQSGSEASFIGAGSHNSITGLYSSIVGGYRNLIGSGNGFASYSFIGGGFSNIVYSNSHYSVIGGGVYNKLVGQFGVVCGGYSNQIGIGGAGNYNVIVGGYDNKIYGNGYNKNRCGIFSGYQNEIGTPGVNGTISDCFIAGGTLNKIKHFSGSSETIINSHILGGYQNSISNDVDNSSILGGYNNSIYSSTIGDGEYNCIIGGVNNKIDTGALVSTVYGQYLTNTHQFCYMFGKDRYSAANDEMYLANSSLRVDNHIRMGGTFYLSGGHYIDGTTANAYFATLSADVKPFKINHPKKDLSSKKYLMHSSIEGPQADLIYRGKIKLENGEATLNIDKVSRISEGTFVELVSNVQIFLQNDTGWDPLKGNVTGNILYIECKNKSSTDTVNWMVVGERKDDTIKNSGMVDDNGHFITEMDKE